MSSVDFNDVLDQPDLPEQTISQQLAAIGVDHTHIPGCRHHHTLFAGSVCLGAMTAFEAAAFAFMAECAA